MALSICIATVETFSYNGFDFSKTP